MMTDRGAANYPGCGAISIPTSPMCEDVVAAQ
jgi:hypothetical protein